MIHHCESSIIHNYKSYIIHHKSSIIHHYKSILGKAFVFEASHTDLQHEECHHQHLDLQKTICTASIAGSTKRDRRRPVGFTGSLWIPLVISHSY